MVRIKHTTALGLAAGILLAAALLVQRSAPAAVEPVTDATGIQRRQLQTIPGGKGGRTPRISCPARRVVCGSQCTDVSSDPLRCGRCHTKCFAPLNKMAYCNNGVCKTTSGLNSCPDGKTKCKVFKLFWAFHIYGCVNPQTNNDHCGACNKKCRGNQYCRDGRCVCRPGSPGNGCDPTEPPTCNPGFKDCDGNAGNGCETAVNTVSNCGDCGAVCPAQANAAPTCSGGACGISCVAGFKDCDGNAANGCETLLNTVGNCGDCGAVCPARANAAPTCTSGACGISCAAGFKNCDGNAANGCETQLNTVNNCGDCGAVCPARGNATPTCVGGICGFTCVAGFKDCDGNAANGCETQLNTISSCGDCGVVCPARANAAPTCSGGACGFTCVTGFKDCDGNAANGCETPLNAVGSCGDCGVVCPARDNATPTCVGSACGFTCTPGFGNCDGNAGNGCETPLNTVSNCGGCGTTCPGGPGAAPTCTGTPPVCGLICAPGFGNCDGNAANGCETPLNTPANCGGCTTACPSGSNSSPTCTGIPPTCGITCAPGFGNCDSNAANGCETPLNTVNNCGGCSTVCPSGPNASPTCTGNPAVCGIVCAPGFGNCDGNAANGCESPLNTPSNCGGCGNSCPGGTNASPTCTGTPAVCGITCAPGFGNCDGNAANGCETHLNTPANCGGCGVVCTFPPNGAPVCEPSTLSCSFICNTGGPCGSTCCTGAETCCSGTCVTPGDGHFGAACCGSSDCSNGLVCSNPAGKGNCVCAAGVRCGTSDNCCEPSSCSSGTGVCQTPCTLGGTDCPSTELCCQADPLAVPQCITQDGGSCLGCGESCDAANGYKCCPGRGCVHNSGCGADCLYTCAPFVSTDCKVTPDECLWRPICAASNGIWNLCWCPTGAADAGNQCLAWDQPCTSTFPPKTLGCDTNIAYYQCQASAESPGPAYGLCIYRDVSGSSSSVFPTLRTCCLGGHAGIANRCAPQGVSLGSCLEIVCPPFQDLCSTCDRATQVCLHDPGPGGNSPTDSVQCGKCVNACSDTVNTRPDGEINCPDPSRCCDNQCLDPAPQPNGAECCGSANNCAAGLVCSATFGRGTCGPVV